MVVVGERGVFGAGELDKYTHTNKHTITITRYQAARTAAMHVHVSERVCVCLFVCVFVREESPCKSMSVPCVPCCCFAATIRQNGRTGGTGSLGLGYCLPNTKLWTGLVTGPEATHSCGPGVLNSSRPTAVS